MCVLKTLFLKFLKLYSFYNFHLQSLRTIFNKHLHKTFYVSCAHNNQFFKTIYFNIFLAFGPEEIIEPVISRKFLKKYVSFNHNPHYHRLLLIKTLYDNDLLNEGYVSGYLYDNNKFVFSSENYPEELLDKNFLNLFLYTYSNPRRALPPDKIP